MKKLALAGDSAGGYLAILGFHMSIEHNGPKICLQVLLYPVVDHRMTSESMDVFTDTPVWNAKKNKEMWKKYLRTMKEEEALLSPMDYPVRNQLPKTYIEVAQYDCLHDEGVVYGQNFSLQVST